MHRPPSFGATYKHAKSETLHLGLAGDADVLMIPAGVRGLVDDEAMDLITSIAETTFKPAARCCSLTSETSSGRG